MNEDSESSNPSVDTQFNAVELMENADNLNSPEKMPTEQRNAIKRQIMLKKLMMSDESTPKLADEGNYVDVASKDDEERELEWIKERFPSSYLDKSHTSSLPSVIKRRKEKKEIQQKLAVQRKIAQDKRRAMYVQDNVGQMDDARDEEDGESYEDDMIDEGNPHDSDEIGHLKNCSLPDSLSQWFNRSEDRLHDNSGLKKDMFKDLMDELGGEEKESQSDLIMLCSGEFASQDSTEQLLHAEEVDADDNVTHGTKKYNNISNYEDDVVETKEGEDKIEDVEEKGATHIKKRIVIECDDESDDEIEEDDGDKEEEQLLQDSDDEMAVFRQQNRWKSNWVEEEAELSGDDIGSDGENEDHLPDVYEAEDGDLDEVPDEETLRRDLHKQLMKQQDSSDHRELVQLRERFLGDDMEGVETNRTFRLKIREDEDVEEGGKEEKIKEEEDEGDEMINMNVIKRRVEMEDDEGSGEGETKMVDAFSLISRSTLSNNRQSYRVRASLLHMDPSKMLGKENVNVKEQRSTFFVSTESNDIDKGSTVSVPIKRKSTKEPMEPVIKKCRNKDLSKISVLNNLN
ncbi:hypothetical protein PFISCL1PPCAC_19860 [Pristionchus fissidentatus]|uniref:Claspin n=1 Tax=Pristionchus fissidentatus TaxID=1538716 RepID=A0AAV5WAK8_9BILA|nr:hypothetical protein PFISCL1PPCAC_19860 [Pristionchus fissidentatus]